VAAFSDSDALKSWLSYRSSGDFAIQSAFLFPRFELTIEFCDSDGYLLYCNG
jgi:hypothetical protein